MMRASLRAILSLGVSSLAVACGSSAGNLFDSAGGSPAATMGGRAPAMGGASAVAGGGSPDEAQGGSESSGGAAANGGKPSVSAGGTASPAGGKASGAGGTASGGAAAAGAAPSSGGDATSGGTAAEGGAPTEGGAPSSGGSAMGGTVSSGGVSASGGAPSVAPIVQSGAIQVAQFTTFTCQQVTFATPFVAAASNLRVLVSVVHPGSTTTHDPVAAWAKNVSETGFDACMSEDAGYNDDHPAARIDWVAMSEPEAATWHFLSGRQALTGSGTPECVNVNLGSDPPKPYHIEASLVSANTEPNHGTAVWVENVNTADFRVCALVLDNAKGPLSSATLDWTAYSSVALEHGFMGGEVDFTTSWRDGAQCRKVTTGCKGCKNAQVTANHRRRTEEDPQFLHGAILAWAEDFSEDGELTVCVRETSTENGAHDSHLSVDWLVRDHND